MSRFDCTWHGSQLAHNVVQSNIGSPSIQHYDIEINVVSMFKRCVPLAYWHIFYSVLLKL